MKNCVSVNSIPKCMESQILQKWRYSDADHKWKNSDHGAGYV